MIKNENQLIQKKNKEKKIKFSSHRNFIGLDKITAKSAKIIY